MLTLDSLLNQIKSKKGFAWILLGQLLSVVTMVASGKIIALYIAPEVFGHYNLLLGAFTLCSSLFFMPLIQAYRFSLQGHDHQQVISFYTTLTYICNCLIALGAGVAFLSGYISAAAAVIFAAYALVQSIQNIVLVYLNLKAQHKSFAISQIILNFSNLAFLILLIICLRMSSIEFLLLVLLSSNALAFGFGFLKFRSQYGLHLNWMKQWKGERALTSELLEYVKPLIGMALLIWLNTQADRFILSAHLSVAEVGYYAAGYGLGSKVFITLVGPLQLYLQPIIFNIKAQNFHPSVGRQATIKALIGYGLVGLVLCVLIFFMRDFIGNILLSPNYQPSFQIIPIIAFSYLISTSSDLIHVTFFAFGYSRTILKIIFCGSATIISLNLLLIPLYGINGAAIACLTGFAIQLILSLYFYSSVINKPLPYLRTE